QDFAGVHRAHSIDGTGHDHVSMVVDDLDLGRPRCGPDETHAELIVHTDAVLALAVAVQRFQPVTGRRTEELQRSRSIELRELANRDVLERTEPAWISAFIERPRELAAERLDHRG